MKIYHYHPVLFVPVRSEDISGDAGDNIPTYSTTVAWPECGALEVPVFSPSTTAWIVQPDYRKATLYSTQTGALVEVGDFDIGQTPEDLGATTLARPTEWHRWQGGAWVDDDQQRNADTTTNVRAMRDERLRLALDVIDRHRNQKEINRPTTITDAEYVVILGYVEDLRNLPEQSGFPLEIVWPLTPPALTNNNVP